MSEPDLSELNFDKKKKKKKTIKLDDEMESLELRKSKINVVLTPGLSVVDNSRFIHQIELKIRTSIKQHLTKNVWV